MNTPDRYILAALRKWNGDSDIDITNIATPTDDGAWVTALLWVSDDELEPEPGPTYVVWACSLNREGTAFGPCLVEATFTCSDDADGQQARANAHEHARSMRRMYPASLMAVKPAEKRLLTPRFNA